MDVFEPQKRSEIMSRIRSKNTKAERMVFSYLRKENIYFQKHYKRAPGKPDIALPRKKLAVFIDGDFWHGRTIDRLIARQGDNSEYWIPKIQSNMRRDKVNESLLAENGWKILRVWERDILHKKSSEAVLTSIALFLRAP